MFKLFNEQKFHEVDKHIEEVERLYPKRQEKTLFWKACAAARQGKIERAISTLYNGIENGIWWNRYTLTNESYLKLMYGALITATENYAPRAMKWCRTN